MKNELEINYDSTLDIKNDENLNQITEFFEGASMYFRKEFPKRILEYESNLNSD